MSLLGLTAWSALVFSAVGCRTGTSYGAGSVEGIEFLAATEGVGTTARVLGDWDDLPASVRTAMIAIDAVVIDRADAAPEDGAPAAMSFQLVTTRGEFMSVDAVRLEDEERSIELHARLGRFGDPERESRLLRGVAQRLAELAGPGAAPITPGDPASPYSAS